MKLVKEWTTSSGYAARILYLHGGYFCGYVGVESDHFLNNVDCTTYYEGGIFDVHGGVTFSGQMDGSFLWWLGFDMAHSGDKTIFNPTGKSYSLEYCIEECEKLSAQIKKLKNSSFEAYINLKKGRKILEEDHNRMIMLSMDDDYYAKCYVEALNKIKNHLEC